MFMASLLNYSFVKLILDAAARPARPATIDLGSPLLVSRSSYRPPPGQLQKIFAADLETARRFLHFLLARFERSTGRNTMNMTTHAPSDFYAFFNPASAYQTPDDVLRDPELSTAEKRMVLSSWASDANVVESQPWLRQIPGADHPVPVASILAALRHLDGEDPPPKGGMAIRLRDLFRHITPVDGRASQRRRQHRHAGLAA
jgi:hypothetical protein